MDEGMGSRWTDKCMCFMGGVEEPVEGGTHLM